MGVEIGTFLNASSRRNGRTTAYHVKLALSNTIVYSDGDKQMIFNRTQKKFTSQ